MKKNKKYWFKAKNYGWGWYPATWQGWTVTLLYVFFIIYITSLNNTPPNQNSFLPLQHIIGVLLATGLLLYICYRTGEKPEWRWGKKK